MARKPKDTVFIESNRYQDVKSGRENMENPPLVVGAGPAGLFASLVLAQRGYRPILLERGQDVDTRTADIDKFWETGILMIGPMSSSAKEGQVPFLMVS